MLNQIYIKIKFIRKTYSLGTKPSKSIGLKVKPLSFKVKLKLSIGLKLKVTCRSI